MKILIIGAGGMVGRKLVNQILQSEFNSVIPSDVYLFDHEFPIQADKPVNRIKGDLRDPNQIEKLANKQFDVIFHLAAIVSGEAESDFDKGWQVNLFSMWHLLDALKQEHINSLQKYVPRMS